MTIECPSPSARWVRGSAVGLCLTLGLCGAGVAGDPLGPVAVSGLHEADRTINALRGQVKACPPSARTDAEPQADTQATLARPPLRWNPRLQAAAERQADAMARTRVFDHVGLDGSTVRERADEAGYGWRVLGENLAAGQARLDDVLQDWLGSASHCAALMDARFTDFGLAWVEARHPYDAYRTYWALVLGAPSDSAPETGADAP